jgi:hypothetical protein
VEPGPHFRKRLYFQIPHMVTCNYVELVRDLMAVKLDDLPARVEDIAVELERLADEAQARLRRLGDRHDLAREHAEVEVERETDDIGQMIQTSFEDWELITNPRFRKEPKPGEEDERAKEDEFARRARAVRQAMFGAEGLEFMRMSYPDRFRTLTAVLRTLRADEDLLEPLHEPVRLYVVNLGPALEEQLAEHLRERDEASSLGEHRVALRWALAVYAFEVGELADRWSAQSCARINASLQPFVDWIERMKQQH